MTSAVDNRFGVGKVASRIGISREAVMIDENTNILSFHGSGQPAEN